MVAIVVEDALPEEFNSIKLLIEKLDVLIKSHNPEEISSFLLNASHLCGRRINCVCRTGNMSACPFLSHIHQTSGGCAIKRVYDEIENSNETLSDMGTHNPSAYWDISSIVLSVFGDETRLARIIVSLLETKTELELILENKKM